MTTTDTELQLLETLGEAQKSSRSVSQRDLAKLAGLSLGMTNMLVKRFVSRGWVKLVRARGRAWVYALTPEGFDEVASRTFDFLRRTASTVKVYYDRIDSFVLDAKGKGYDGIVYDAPFDIEFIFRYSCQRHGLFFYMGNPDMLYPELKGVRYIHVGACEGLPEGEKTSSRIAGEEDLPVCVDVDVVGIFAHR